MTRVAEIGVMRPQVEECQRCSHQQLAETRSGSPQELLEGVQAGPHLDSGLVASTTVRK